MILMGRDVGQGEVAGEWNAFSEKAGFQRMEAKRD